LRERLENGRDPINGINNQNQLLSIEKIPSVSVGFKKCNVDDNGSKFLCLHFVFCYEDRAIFICRNNEYGEIMTLEILEESQLMFMLKNGNSKQHQSINHSINRLFLPLFSCSHP
jgi:hypothetical protein